MKKMKDEMKMVKVYCAYHNLHRLKNHYLEAVFSGAASESWHGNCTSLNREMNSIQMCSQMWHCKLKLDQEQSQDQQMPSLMQPVEQSFHQCKVGTGVKCDCPLYYIPQLSKFMATCFSCSRRSKQSPRLHTMGLQDFKSLSVGCRSSPQ